MKSKFLTFYSVLISLIFIFTLSFFTLNLLYEYNHGLERTKRRFDHLENVINNANSERQIENAIGNLNDFSYLKITNGNNCIFIYPTDNSIQNPETRLVKNYSSGLNSSRFYIEASLYTLRPATIHYYAKISFLIIILSTTITLIIIVCIALNENDNKSNVIIEEIEELSELTTDEKISEDETDAETSVKDLSFVRNEIDSILEKDNTIENKAETEEEKITEEINDNIDSDLNTASLPEDQSKPVIIKQAETSIETIKSADELLELRLEKELNRAISTELDLSLFLIRIPEILKENTIYNEVLEKLTEEFQYKDLIFEVNNDCFAAIKLNTSIDEALDFADALNHSITNIISTDNKICFIGIAARTLRMVSAKRMIFESKEALVHAQQDSETPIVAFKVDAEKYMRMMENE